MKKSQLIAVMSVLTVAGIAMVSAGLLSLSQQPSYTLAQAWNELWEQHAPFAWVTTIYCFVMLTLDIWVVAGIIAQTSQRKPVYNR